MAKRARSNPPSARHTAPAIPAAPELESVERVPILPRALLPEGLGSPGWVGLCALLLALVLAPVLGGLPSGAMSEQDPAPGVLRLLVLLAAILTPPPAKRMVGFGLWPVFALTAVSLLWHSRFFTSDVLLFAMLPATLDWLCCALVFTLARNLTRDRKAVTLLTLALVAGAAWTALAGAQEYGQRAENAQRVQAFFVSPNFLAGFLGLCLPIATASFLRARSIIGAVTGGAVTALVAGVLVATGSRLGIAAAGAGLLVALGLALAGGVRVPWARVGALAVAVVCIGWGFRGPITNRVSGGAGASQDHSGAFRTLTWKGTGRMARANPLLGTGPGTYEFRYPPYALVARTNLAHSSYLQMAAEQGFPALLAALATLAITFIVGVRSLLHRPKEGEAAEPGSRLLLCGLFGALVTGAIRSAFDSEWSLLGTALPFWSVAGMVAGAREALTPQPPLPILGEGEPGYGNDIGFAPGEGPSFSPSPRIGRGGWGVRAFPLPALAAALLLTLLLLFNAVTLGQARKRAPGMQDSESALRAARAWPPDPTALALRAYFMDEAGALELLERAAHVEPSGRRFYQLGRLHRSRKRLDAATRWFERALRADPTSLQTLRALAETRAEQGDRAGALAAWRELVRLHQGPVGQVRALPELPETYPAWAYAALAEAAERANRRDDALGLYEKAAAIVEDYADTTPTYRRLEIAGAQQTGADLNRRRTELRALYTRVMDRLLQTAGAASVPALGERKTKTLALLERSLSEEMRPAGGGL